MSSYFYVAIVVLGFLIGGLMVAYWRLLDLVAELKEDACESKAMILVLADLADVDFGKLVGGSSKELKNGQLLKRFKGHVIAKAVDGRW